MAVCSTCGTVTVGSKLAGHTNMDVVDQQAATIEEHFWPRLYRFLSEYPHMMERISRLRTFAARYIGCAISAATRM